jgi:hypothetical protein
MSPRKRHSRLEEEDGRGVKHNVRIVFYAQPVSGHWVMYILIHD